MFGFIIKASIQCSFVFTVRQRSSLFKLSHMKKVPSYPKISSKTNITVTHTHNININSPKALGSLSNNKLFKHKGSMQAAQDSEFRSHFKTRPIANKPIRRQSSGNLNKPKQLEIVRETTGSKTEIRKIQEKIKELQKKIDTLKMTKKKKEMPSNRSHSKIKETQVTTILQKKPSMGSIKKNEGSLKKALKQTQSDKYLLKYSKPPKSQNPLNLTTNSHKKQDEELIHKFVTQVNRVEANKAHIQHSNQKIACYYIENALESIHKNYLLPFREHLTQSIQTLKYLQKNRKPTTKQLQKHSVVLPANKFRYSLVLDLDETLIHCNQHLSLPHDVTLKIKFPTGEKVDAGINVRPFAKQLLEQLSKVCEIVVFTASHECYANVVLNHLDPKGQLVTHRLFRSQCWQTEEGVYIKDLRVLKNRNLQNVLLVDNAAYSYFYQLQNGIPIIPFYDDKEDEQLLHLIHYIKDLIEIKQSQKQNISLQELNHRYFQLSAYSDYEDIELLTTKLYKQTIVSRRKMIV